MENKMLRLVLLKISSAHGHCCNSLVTVDKAVYFKLSECFCFCKMLKCIKYCQLAHASRSYENHSDAFTYMPMERKMVWRCLNDVENAV